MTSQKILEVLMCKPIHFEITYVINPWMKNQRVDQEKALRQWENLVEIYKNLGIIVHDIEQKEGLPDMTFSADCGVVKNNKVLLSNYATKERAGEREVYKTWFLQHGYEIMELPAHHTFEGNGESLFFKDKLLVGTGFRTNEASFPEISKLLDIEVVPVKLIDPYFYHIDTCVFPLSDEVVFYFPPAVDTESTKRLKKIIPHLIPFSTEEARAFCANSIVTHGKVVCEKAVPSFVKQVENYGFEAIESDVSEFNKSGGGIHCLTNVIKATTSSGKQ